ncbi:MAG: hypothetical protein CL920_30470 [Deltaproteobacteria bacterium]|nr:hypothetical protein [Deltaproteobacteria bacterium]MBU53039.1 hypothetical protein [Deltaproteobacteria bacterium]|tara:strand:- start:4101 stop:5360 length:1260 start_codon:yes stop_codon:yes gene_type:complete
MKRSLYTTLALTVCICTFNYVTACTGPAPSEQTNNETTPAEQLREQIEDASSPKETAPQDSQPQDTITPEPTREITTEKTPEAIAEAPQETTPEVPQVCTLLPNKNIQDTWTWAQSATPPATGMMVYQNETKLFEDYNRKNAGILLPAGGAADKEFSMYSMTKSLSGLAALILVKQKKLTLDDKVSTYITAWKTDADKSKITIRELLSLSSGIKTEVKTTNKINLQDAIDTPFVKKQFQYGSEPFTLFSHIIKIITTKDAETFLKEELFDKLGMSLRIARIKDGTETANLANGGFVTLPEIKKLAEELLAASLGKGKIFDINDIKTLRTPGLNPTYGLSVWLNSAGIDTTGTSIKATYPDCGDDSVFHMLGAGGQVVTIVPPKRLLILKSSKVGSVEAQSRQEFWDKLFTQVQCTCVIP